MPSPRPLPAVYIRYEARTVAPSRFFAMGGGDGFLAFQVPFPSLPSSLTIFRLRPFRSPRSLGADSGIPAGTEKPAAPTLLSLPTLPTSLLRTYLTLPFRRAGGTVKEPEFGSDIVTPEERNYSPVRCCFWQFRAAAVTPMCVSSPCLLDCGRSPAASVWHSKTPTAWEIPIGAGSTEVNI